MRSLLFTATVAAAALGLAGCPYHKQQPVPGPQSTISPGLTHPVTQGALAYPRPREPAADSIRFFQGTLDEAFAGGAMGVRTRAAAPLGP